MSLSYQTTRVASQARDLEEHRSEARKRNLTVLIHRYLLEEGLMDSAKTLENESSLDLCCFEVCDNVDLDTVLLEYESYYFVKFQKYPRLTKKVLENGKEVKAQAGDGHVVKSGRRKRMLPRIIHQATFLNPRKSESEAASRHTNKSSSESEEPTQSFGLNVSPIFRSGSADRKHTRKNDFFNQDESQSGPEFAERFLRPLSGGFGVTSEMRELASLIYTEIYSHNPNVHWNDIKGLDAAKRLVKEAVVYPIKYPQLFTGILSPWRGLLLYGPPGTGKTMLAKAVATECNTTFFNISASSIVSKWRGESEKLVRVLFELARFHAPSTIFLDELESVMSQRGLFQGGEHEGSRRMKTELLVQMDGLAQSNDLVFVLAASNLPWELDQAMLRRLEKRMLVGLPSASARQDIVKHWLPPTSNIGGVKLKTDLDYVKIAEEMEGYTGSDIKLVCKEAAMRPVRKVISVLENNSRGQTGNRPIELETVSTADLLEVIAHTKPTAGCLTERYAAWEKEYESV